MTVDLHFVQQSSVQATLAQLAAELGLQFQFIAQRAITMEIFRVHVFTVQLDADAPVLAAAGNWFTSRGIHWLAR